ncbi:MAG: aromatic ring-hydroxylating dioxygenase subunit alpha [Polaromonas sp.]|nr:aromatic ring-hydroxylating dioxygenase subunit alpha [Polaromonas sp.]
MWLKNAWYVAAFSDELGESLLPRTLLGQKVVMFRGPDGRPVALADKCPHRGVPLSRGTLIGDTIRCSYHGLRIGSDGICKHIPCQDLIPAQARVATYPLHERHDIAWVWMGEADRADPALIPDVYWLEHPDWTACHGYHRVEANYQLFNDNLLDLSHESYLHDKTIGNEAVAEAPVSTSQGDNEIRVHREISNCEPPPFYVTATGFTTRINRWHTTIFRPPSFNLIENGSYPVDRSREEALERRVIHLVTPETGTSSHYFWGIARAYKRDDAALTAFIREQSSRTFDEDKDMLEAQQQSLGAQDGAAFPMALKTDAGPIQARRLLKRLIEAEQADTARNISSAQQAATA